MRRPWVWSLLLTGMGLSLGCKHKSSVSGDVPTMDPHTPSQILRDFQMQDIQDGVKSMVVDSIQGRLIDAQQVSEVDQPIVSFYKQGAISSVLRAPQGRIQMETHEVQAWGGVTVVTTDSATLTTNTLRYDPKRQHLVTDDPVTLVRPGSITDGIGLDATPDLSRVKIGHEKVRLRNS